MTAYTTNAKVGSLLNTSFTNATDPTASEVDTFISWADARIDRITGTSFSNNTQTNEYVDVFRGYESTSPRYFLWPGQIIYLRHWPIISVTNLYENEAELDEAADWVERTEGPGTNSSFIILKRDFLGQYLGYALYFYDNFPEVGPQRLRVTYNWGFSSVPSLIEELSTVLAALKVLVAKQGVELAVSQYKVEALSAVPKLPTHLLMHANSLIKDLPRKPIPLTIL